MGTLHHPEPGEPEPLSAREKKILSAIEDDLNGSAPGLSDLSDELGRGLPSRPAVDRALQVLSVAAIVLVIVPSDWLPVIVIVVVMVGLPIAASFAGRSGVAGQDRDPTPED